MGNLPVRRSVTQAGEQTAYGRPFDAASTSSLNGSDSNGSDSNGSDSNGSDSNGSDTLGSHTLGPRIELLEDDVIIDLRADPPVLMFRDTEVGLNPTLPSKQERRIVRALDLAIAVPVFVLTLPLMAMLAILVAVTSKGPMFYRSNRQTRSGVWFEMLKFRTMVSDADDVLEQYFADNPDAKERFERHNKFRVDPRVTKIGRVLRKFSLDELPQLVNVIRGDMSVVGPRPQLDFEVERFGSARPTVQRVKGGMTGLWQVSGRSHLTFEERLALEVEYATTRTLKKDLGIIAKTATQLVNGSPGAY